MDRDISDWEYNGSHEARMDTKFAGVTEVICIHILYARVQGVVTYTAKTRSRVILSKVR